MNDIVKLVAEVETELDEFARWQVEHGANHGFRGFAEQTGRAEDVFKYAAILYPEFVKIEGVILLADHYSADNWNRWRKTHDAAASALAVNHVHVDHYLPNDVPRSATMLEGMGKLLAFFWQIAVSRQFPDTKVIVEYNGDVISFTQKAS